MEPLISARPSLAAAVGVGMLALGTAVLVVLAMQQPPTPERAGTGVTPLPTTPRSPGPEPTMVPSASPELSLVFMGDDHLAEWAPMAGRELAADVRVESGVSLFEEPTVADVLADSPPDIVVLSIGTADVAWADDFQFALTEAVDAVQSAWPDSQLVLMRPAWADPGDLEAEKNEITEQVAMAQGATYLDADANAADFVAAWNAAGL